MEWLDAMLIGTCVFIIALCFVGVAYSSKWRAEFYEECLAGKTYQEMTVDCHEVHFKRGY